MMLLDQIRQQENYFLAVDSSLFILIDLSQLADGWVIWPVRIVPEMTYKVSSGTLNLCSLTVIYKLHTNDDKYVIA